MCNRIKNAKQITCATTVYWDLINSNMNGDVQERCANGLDRVYTCSIYVAAIQMMRIVNVLQLINGSCKCYETEFEFRSLMA